MRKLYVILPLLFTLAACNTSRIDELSPVDMEDEPIYAMFMANFPRSSYSSPNGNETRIDNLLFEKVEISKDQPFAKPDTDPNRPNYLFDGWYKEAACENAWDFSKDSSSTSVFLYAKWKVDQEEEYIEPEYVYPETIIEDRTFTVTGILNFKVEENKANVTTGALKRLEANKDDVKFAINYQRHQDINMTSAVYDVSMKKINITLNEGDPIEISIIDASASYNIGNENAGFETKAVNYEEKGKDYENYHIVLGGSSSMEFWAASSEDMMPIISYNHGIAGSTVEQWTNKLMPRLMAPYSPKAVVYYVGVNNIINSSDDGLKTGQRLEQLFNKTHEYLPNTQIFYVLINKLPGFLSQQPQFDIANGMALDFAKNNSWLTCIDAGEGLLKPNGNPHYAYFRMDGLHMSDYGYIIWGAAIKKAIMNWLG